MAVFIDHAHQYATVIVHEKKTAVRRNRQIYRMVPGAYRRRQDLKGRAAAHLDDGYGIAVAVGHKNVMTVRRNRYSDGIVANGQGRQHLVRRIGARFYLDDT